MSVQFSLAQMFVVASFWTTAEKYFFLLKWYIQQSFFTEVSRKNQKGFQCKKFKNKDRDIKKGNM